jgi:hypothetical protein
MSMHDALLLQLSIGYRRISSEAVFGPGPRP